MLTGGVTEAKRASAAWVPGQSARSLESTVRSLMVEKERCRCPASDSPPLGEAPRSETRLSLSAGGSTLHDVPHQLVHGTPSPAIVTDAGMLMSDVVRSCRQGGEFTQRVWSSPSRTARVVARFLPVGLSVGVTTSSASPSQSKDSGTRYGSPSAEALATQTSMSWVSRCSVSRQR